MAKFKRFTTRDLLHMLKSLEALAVTPDGRQMIARELERTVERSKVGSAMRKRIQLMYDYFRDPAEPIGPKLLIGAALLYLVNPVDFINDFLPVIGLTDDLAALAIIWRQTKDILTHYEQRRNVRLAAGGAA